MLKKAKFLAKELRLRAGYIMNKDCIFCKIIDGEIKADSVFEDDSVLAFNDINPVTDVHILVIPKRHIDSVLTLEGNDREVLFRMFEAVKKITKDKKIDSFRLAYNAGKFQHVPHLHMHILAGRKMEWKKL